MLYLECNLYIFHSNSYFILIIALTGKFVNTIIAKLRSKTRRESPLGNSFFQQHVALLQTISNGLCEKNTIICSIYDPLLLIAKWRVCFKIHSLWTKVRRPWRPRTRNIVPCLICISVNKKPTTTNVLIVAFFIIQQPYMQQTKLVSCS